MYKDDFKELTIENENFRKVLFTGKHSQLVAMCIAPNEDIGEEVHKDTDQILFFIEGVGEAIIEGKARQIGADDVVFVPAGIKHNFQNIGTGNLKLLSIHAPPEHEGGLIEKTKK